MNTLADTRSGTEQDQVEAGRRDAEPAQDAALLELGKVSDTQGGWLGPKLDSGAGFQPY
ncbi:MAG TPA: hypothetical protein VHY36_02565 [Steroidobacteraceae bacterium]|jgi:hypothetical protein|nr:hypothetical protein [Steroidobacteraceae bacterium]